jgi:hypothetical protein
MYGIGIGCGWDLRTFFGYVGGSETKFSLLLEVKRIKGALVFGPLDKEVQPFGRRADGNLIF